MKPRHKRLAWIGGIVASVAVAAGLVLNAFQSNLVFFFSPSQVMAKEAPAAKTFRLGGMVKEGSVKRNGTEVAFDVTDTAQTINVKYVGILPDLFKEGKGVVAQGQLQGDGVFVANVLTDFLDFNDFLDVADGIVDALDLDGIIQVASFHPQFQFEATFADDITNYTNRSPYPMLHLLREDSVAWAVAAFPDELAIADANIKTLEKLGHEGWAALRLTTEANAEDTG